MRIPDSSPLSYTFRHLMYFLPIVIAPALLLALSHTAPDPTSLITLLIRMSPMSGEFVVDNFFYDVFSCFTLFNTTRFFWIWIIGLTVAFVCVCIVFSTAERHMRLGVLTYPSLRNTLNYTIVPVLSYFVGLLFVLELCNLVGCGVVSLLLSLGVRGAGLIVMTLLVGILFYVINLVLITMSICTVPSRLMDGYKLNVAISYSIQLVSADFWLTFLNTTLLILPITVIRILTTFAYSAIDWFNAVFCFIIMFVYYCIILCLVPAFCLSNYIRLTNGQRKDLKQRLF